MAGVESEIYENDVELPKYSEKPPYASLRPNNQELGKTQRRDNTSPANSQSKWFKCFAITVVVALVISIILACVIIAIVVTKINSSDETKANEENHDDDPTNTDPSQKDVIPLTIPGELPANCKEIKDLQPQAKSGNYVIRIEGTERILLVYCDHETADGGWTLVYGYGFTNYTSFNHKTNAVTPIPNWNAAPNGVVPKISTLTPRNEDDKEAMDFSYWRAMGTEFLVKSNINNWIWCSPSGISGGSLVDWKSGNVTCEMVKVIHDCPTGNKLPVRLLASGHGPALITRYTGNYYSYFWIGRTDYSYPYHDPCGVNGLNHRMLVQNPRGSIFLR